MTSHVFMVRSVLESDVEQVERLDDIGITFEVPPGWVEIQAGLERVLLELEPACSRVVELRFSRIA